MDWSVSEIIVWLIVGAIAGSVTGTVVKRKKQGFGTLSNLGIGLVGAVIGGVLFNLLRIDFGMSKIQISLQDLVSAFAGSLLFLLVIWAVRKQRARAKARESAGAA